MLPFYYISKLPLDLRNLYLHLSSNTLSTDVELTLKPENPVEAEDEDQDLLALLTSSQYNSKEETPELQSPLDAYIPACTHKAIDWGNIVLNVTADSVASSYCLIAIAYTISKESGVDYDQVAPAITAVIFYLSLINTFLGSVEGILKKEKSESVLWLYGSSKTHHTNWLLEAWQIFAFSMLALLALPHPAFAGIVVSIIFLLTKHAHPDFRFSDTIISLAHIPVQCRDEPGLPLWLNDVSSLKEKLEIFWRGFANVVNMLLLVFLSFESARGLIRFFDPQRTLSPLITFMLAAFRAALTLFSLLAKMTLKGSNHLHTLANDKIYQAVLMMKKEDTAELMLFQALVVEINYRSLLTGEASSLVKTWQETISLLVVPFILALISARDTGTIFKEVFETRQSEVTPIQAAENASSYNKTKGLYGNIPTAPQSYTLTQSFLGQRKRVDHSGESNTITRSPSTHGRKTK